MKVKIENATPDLASHIASLIMEAMGAECCQNFAGHSHTLVDFHRMMTKMVEMEDSQYSYRNTLLAFTSGGILAGVCVAYDGAQLQLLRRRFYESALSEFGIDYTGMADETEEGEYYIDSLAVSRNFRGKGIATELLKTAISHGHELGIPKVGLLVDKGNPKAESLYARLGFEYVNDATWGGHPMRHLQYREP